MWAWRDLNRLHELEYAALADRVQQVDAQLDAQLAGMRELLKEYADVQEQRLQSTLQLLAAEEKLEQASTELETLRSADWETRFQEESGRRAALEARAAEMEQQIARAAGSRRQLAESTAARERHEQELAAATQEIGKLKRQLATLTGTRSIQAVDEGAGYRDSRMASLRDALANRSSAERRSILENVIPTIPGGIQAAELKELIAGMDSMDARALLETIHAHVRSSNDAGLAPLLETMTPDDAAAVAQLPLFRKDEP